MRPTCASLELVDSMADCVVTITGDLTHRCPFKDERDFGTVTIAYHIDGKTIELHSLREWLCAFRDAEISHEELTDAIRDHIAGLPGMRLISVETTWRTACMEVRCSTSPTPAGSLS